MYSDHNLLRQSKREASHVSLLLLFATFPRAFSIRAVEADLGYLGDLLGVRGACLQHLHLLVDIRRVHPLALQYLWSGRTVCSKEGNHVLELC